LPFWYFFYARMEISILVMWVCHGADLEQVSEKCYDVAVCVCVCVCFQAGVFRSNQPRLS
jgi:hypothetical protein